jgi:hypothetical protein
MKAPLKKNCSKAYAGRQAAAVGGLVGPLLGCPEEDMAVTDPVLVLLHAMNAARGYLETAHSFRPFGYILAPSPAADPVRVTVPGPCEGSDAVLLQRVRSELHRAVARGAARAVALVREEEALPPEGVPGAGRAVRVQFEHAELDPVVWLIPYRRERGAYVFGDGGTDAIRLAGKREFFP